MRRFPSLCVFSLVLAVSGAPLTHAQSLKDAKVVGTFGNWKVLRSTDPMKDTTSCTGVYNENYGVQLTPDTLYLSVQGGIESVTLRFDDKPAQALRLPQDAEKKIRSVIVKGKDFSEFTDSSRLRYQVSTLVSGIKTEDLDLTGISAALENIRSGCPLQEGIATPALEVRPSSPLCSKALIARMKSQGLRDEQVTSICR